MHLDKEAINEIKLISVVSIIKIFFIKSIKILLLFVIAQVFCFLRDNGRVGRFEFKFYLSGVSIRFAFAPSCMSHCAYFVYTDTAIVSSSHNICV